MHNKITNSKKSELNILEYFCFSTETEFVLNLYQNVFTKTLLTNLTLKLISYY